MMGTSDAVLRGLRIVEFPAFIAAPLGGLTLAQLGADVIRVDPVGGNIDIGRWPLDAEGRSLYWASLNRGKRSVEIDVRKAQGKRLLSELITAPGEGGGILSRIFLSTASFRTRHSRPCGRTSSWCT